MKSKNILVTLFLLLILSLIFYFFIVPIFTIGPSSKPSSDDPLKDLTENNSLYREASELSRQGNYREAVTSLEKAKLATVDTSEEAIIAFSIAQATFNQDKIKGLKAFTDIAQNTAYPERTRALALLRAYLLYLRYQDVDMLEMLAREQGIPLVGELDTEQVVYDYMKNIDNLHPFPLSSIKMLTYKLDSAPDGVVAKQLYDSSHIKISEGIKSQKLYTGEQMELTSSMLHYALLLDRLATNYNNNIVSAEEVKTAYQELIDYDNANKLIVNKQYTIMYYANYLSSIGEFSKAEDVLMLIVQEGLNKDVNQGLSKSDPQEKFSHLVNNLDSFNHNPEVSTLIRIIGIAR